MSDLAQFGSKLRELRVARGVTLNELAQALGYASQPISTLSVPHSIA